MIDAKTPNLFLEAANVSHAMGEDFYVYYFLLCWAQRLPIYSCDDLGLCNGPNEKHDCVDCPKKS